MVVPKKGSVWLLKEPSPLGAGAGMIVPGTQVEVVELDRDGTLEGAGAAGEPTVLAQLEEDGTVINEEGVLAVGKTTRIISVPTDQFVELFEEAK